MADLIDRQTVIDMFQRLAYDDWNQGANTTWANAYAEAAEMVRDLPSAESEIIRCGNCKWKYNNICTRAIELFIDDDDFCSWAERR